MCDANPLYRFLLVTYEGDEVVESQKDFLSVWKEGSKGKHIDIDHDMFINNYDCWLVHASSDDEKLQQLIEEYSEKIIIPYSLGGISGSEAVMGKLLKKTSKTQEILSYIVNHRDVLLNPQLLSEYDSKDSIECEYLKSLVEKGEEAINTTKLRKQALEAIANGDTDGFKKLKSQIVESRDE